MKSEFSIWILAFIATMTLGWATLVWGRISEHIKEPNHAEAGAIIRAQQENLKDINRRLVRIEDKLDTVIKEQYKR